MNLAAFGVRKPVAANLVMIVIIGAGLIFGTSLRREFFPETRPKEVVVSAPYPGATPQEIEDTLAREIEDRVFNLSDVEEINTVITEGMAAVRIEYDDSIDIDKALDEVKREIDALEDLPEDSDRIRVDKVEPQLPVINMTLTGDTDERTLKDSIRQMRDDLELLPGMGDIIVSGVRRDEISVEVSPAAMLQHRLSLPDITARVRSAMAELSAGPVRAGTSHIAVRTMGTAERADAVREIVIKADPNGQALHLGDIATVHGGFVDVDTITKINGRTAVSLIAYTASDEDAIDMAKMVKAYAAGRTRQPPAFRGWDPSKPTDGSESAEAQAYRLGLTRPALGPEDLVLHTDLARFISQRLNLLQRNALWGGTLVFLTLMIMLNWRVAFWVGVGLVTSLLGTLAVMHFLDITLNLLTMFGLIVVLGLLVDDAIVVAENIVARHEQGEPALVAAVNGTNQVAWPVVTTVLTTICAFLPLTLIEGRIGDLLGALPVVVTVALLVSLVESLLILPCHMGHSLARLERRQKVGKRNRLLAKIEWFQDTVLKGFLDSSYRKVLAFCLRFRYFAVASAVAMLIASLSMPVGGRLPFTFSTETDSETVIADITMPIGTPLHRTAEVVQLVESAAEDLPEVTSIFALVGLNVDPNGESATTQTHLGQLYVELAPAEDRDRTSETIISIVRERLGIIPGIRSMRFRGIHGGPSGLPISFTASSSDATQIEPVVERIRALLQEYEGVFDVADDSDRGQRELRITLRDSARELGLTTAGVAQQLRAAVFGLEAHTFADNQEDVDVRVMADKATRRSLAALEHMHIFTPQGDPVPLMEVAHLEESQTYASIRRKDRRRAISVSADVDSVVINPEDVLLALAPKIQELRRQYPAVRIIAGGRQEELQKSFATLPLGMITAAGLIYVILAWLFSSYTQPLIVMLAVPFASVGVIWGHIIMGFSLTVLSLIGFVALTGIVVNDSLIFMEFYNMKRRAGVPATQAAYATGKARLRPILLTTITTVLGLSPLMLEQSFQARFLIPMAITISFGLISATALTLLLLPALLVIAQDIRRLLRFLWTGEFDGRLREDRPGSQALQPSATSE